MALVLNFCEGDAVYIAGKAYTLADARKGAVRLLTDAGQIFDVTDYKSTEIAPDVFVSIGLPSAAAGIRLAFRAPPHIKIDRLPPG